MATSVTMTYGSYSFSPVPSFTINRNSERTPGLDFCLSTPLEIQLDGKNVAQTVRVADSFMRR